eukprot:12156240-Ditylum_brightwellii.AAC.1
MEESSCRDEDEDWDIYWEEWMVDISQEEEPTASEGISHLSLQKGLPSILNNNAGQALLSSPRTICQHCLSPLHFQIVLCRWLRLLIRRKHRPCICGLIVDRYGDHYFDCARHSKMWLHNKCRDYNITWLQQIISLTGIAPSTLSVQKEPTHVSCKFLGIRPLDIGVTTMTGLKGLDVTITGTAPATPNSAEQGRHAYAYTPIRRC